MSKIYKTIDLCAGIGGIRRGYELAGCFRNVLSAEIDKNACLTYKHLYGEDAMNDITTEEFKSAVQKCCVGKTFDAFPQAMKMFINNHFKIVDVNGDGIIGIEEYRYNCVNRLPVSSIEKLDESYQKLCNDDDRRRGGLTLSRYQELYGQFLADPKDDVPAVHLFGPLNEV